MFNVKTKLDLKTKFTKFHNIPRYTVNSFFYDWFGDSVQVFHIMEIIRP